MQYTDNLTLIKWTLTYLKYLNPNKYKGHIAHLRKQFNSINTYDYHNGNWEKKKPIIYFLRIECSSFEHIWIPLTRGCFAPNLVEIGPVVLGKKIYILVKVFLLFGNYLPIEKGGALPLNKLDSSLPMIAFCQVWLKLAQWFWRRR